jgi:hypothetical protein
MSFQLNKPAQARVSFPPAPLAVHSSADSSRSSQVPYPADSSFFALPDSATSSHQLGSAASSPLGSAVCPAGTLGHLQATAVLALDSSVRRLVTLASAYQPDFAGALDLGHARNRAASANLGHLDSHWARDRVVGHLGRGGRDRLAREDLYSGDRQGSHSVQAHVGDSLEDRGDRRCRLVEA